MVADLGAGGGQQALLGRAPAHRPRAEVGDEGPGAENRRRAGLDRVHVDQPAKALRPGLRHRAGQVGRRRGAGLGRRQQQDGHAALHGYPQAFEGVGCELQRRDDEAVRLADERTGAPRGLAAGDRVQHLEALLEVLVHRPARTDVLARAHHRAVERVDVQRVVVGDIARHAGPLEHVNVFAGIGDARHVVQVLRLGVPVQRVLRVRDHDGGAGGGEVHSRAAQVQVPPWVLAVQHQVSAGVLEGLFHQRARHAQAPVVAEHGAGRGAGFDAVGRGVGEPHPFENPEGVVHDGEHAFVGKGSELSAGLSRPYGLDRFGQGCGALGLARASTA